MDNQDLISMGIEFLKLSDSCLDKVILSKNAIPYFKKATQSLKMGNFIEAISAYDKVIELDSKYFLAYLGKGIAYSHLQMFQNAVDSYDQALLLNSADYKIFVNKGLALIELKQFDEAIECFNQAIAMESEEADIFHNKGILLQILGKQGDAFDCFEIALSIQPNNPIYLCSLLKLVIEMKAKQNEYVHLFYQIQKTVKAYSNNKDIEQIKQKLPQIQNLLRLDLNQNKDLLQIQLKILEQLLHGLTPTKYINIPNNYPYHLKEYYTAFYLNLHNLYVTSQAIVQGDIIIDAHSSIQNVVQIVISLLPFFWDDLSKGFDFIYKSIKENQVQKQAQSLLHLTPNFQQYEEFIMKLSLLMIKNIEKEIETYCHHKEDSQIEIFLKQMKQIVIFETGDINYETPQQQLGQEHASFYAQLFSIGLVLENHQQIVQQDQKSYQNIMMAQCYDIFEKWRRGELSVMNYEKQLKESKITQDLMLLNLVNEDKIDKLVNVMRYLMIVDYLLMYGGAQILLLI